MDTVTYLIRIIERIAFVESQDIDIAVIAVHSAQERGEQVQEKRHVCNGGILDLEGDDGRGMGGAVGARLTRGRDGK